MQWELYAKGEGYFARLRTRLPTLAFFPMRLLFRIRVAGHSMLPSLAPGDRLLCLGGFRRRLCTPGAIVVTRAPVPENLVVKRVSKVLADGSFEVEGDNRDVSRDSRHFGALSPHDYEGRVLCAYRPWPRLLWHG